MLVSIIIPHHTEDLAMMTNLLDVIYAQEGISKNEYEVLLCNDDEEHIITDLSRWPGMDIRNLMVDGTGNPGISRQCGIDNSRGDWLVFCDADDRITSIFFLHELLSIIAQYKGDCDAIGAQFIQEVKDRESDKKVYIRQSVEFTWMFSKIYKKDFLLRNNIRFHKDLKVHEDSYFNAIFKAYNPKIVMLKDSFYLWKYNAESITRRNSASYSYDSLTTFIDAIQWANDEVNKRNIKDITDSVCHLAVYMYNMLQTEQFKRPEYMEYVPEIEKRVYEFMEHFKNQFNNIKPEAMNQILQSEMIKNSKNGLFYFTEGWPEFCARLKKTYGSEKK